MNMRHLTKQLLIPIAIVLLGLSSTTAESQAVKANFLYNLANFTGPLPYSWVRVSIDQERNEVYVLEGNFLKIFNKFGMEIYRFGDGLDLGYIVDVAVDRNGDILLYSYKDSKSAIVRCNYRGEPISKNELKNLPPEFSGFG